MTYIDDEERKSELEAEQQILAQRDIEDIQFVMGSEQGRRVVWRVLESGRVFAAIPPMDALAMAFNEGQRNLALELFQRVMTHCPDQYLKMAAEAGEDNV
ncbi:hypothetical protein DO628_13250 [Salmonella enterica subsp. salamae]|uniref:Bbp19-like phage domain-containing protein n=2 Tax=Salmonella enterica TaxID=28901 RepID=A0A8F7UCR4_SALER|nr:hypothetical protein [Salmonella enterica]EAA4082894.1 hypothetical protein [Salmonella enterica subsp. salamae serovar Sofia]EDV4963402.1 hypothetical protein [Salmonella enterica subsp. salamae]EBS4542146.1 hypothetical protein [Salmonella enterica subsp. salamae serovar Sofia]ECF5971261.1 hypothetical protein [Salmonella enterica subsp. salamae serovar Sofia]QXX11637.1 hypothetical protein JMJ87_23820 [Salmonella enterica]